LPPTVREHHRAGEIEMCCHYMIFLGLYDYGVYQFSWFFFREDLIFGGYLEFMSLLFVKADKSQKAVLKSNSFKILDDKHIIQFS
jgi:hypothetical protein